MPTDNFLTILDSISPEHIGYIAYRPDAILFEIDRGDDFAIVSAGKTTFIETSSSETLCVLAPLRALETALRQEHPQQKAIAIADAIRPIAELCRNENIGNHPYSSLLAYIDALIESISRQEIAKIETFVEARHKIGNQLVATATDNMILIGNHHVIIEAFRDDFIKQSDEMSRAFQVILDRVQLGADLPPHHQDDLISAIALHADIASHVRSWPAADLERSSPRQLFLASNDDFTNADAIIGHPLFRRFIGRMCASHRSRTYYDTKIRLSIRNSFAAELELPLPIIMHLSNVEGQATIVGPDVAIVSTIASAISSDIVDYADGACPPRNEEQEMHLEIEFEHAGKDIISTEKCTVTDVESVRQIHTVVDIIAQEAQTSMTTTPNFRVVTNSKDEVTSQHMEFDVACHTEEALHVICSAIRLGMIGDIRVEYSGYNNAINIEDIRIFRNGTLTLPSIRIKPDRKIVSMRTLVAETVAALIYERIDDFDIGYGCSGTARFYESGLELEHYRNEYVNKDVLTEYRYIQP